MFSLENKKSNHKLTYSVRIHIGFVRIIIISLACAVSPAKLQKMKPMIVMPYSRRRVTRCKKIMIQPCSFRFNSSRLYYNVENIKFDEENESINGTIDFVS